VRAEFGQLRQASLIAIHSTADEKFFQAPQDIPPTFPEAA
jgi:hypothetical protein